MSLIELKHHLMQVRMTTLNNLCALFHAEPETMRTLISYWVRKGNVRQCLSNPACAKRCVQCPQGNTNEIYEWIVVAPKL